MEKAKRRAFILLSVVLSFVVITVWAATGDNSVRRDTIPKCTYFHPPIGSRDVDIQEAIKVESPNGYYITTFPGDYSYNGAVCHGWYVYTDFNKNRTADGGCYSGSEPSCGSYHPGEDWNGRGGGDSDMGQPVYAVGRGLVFWKGWANGFGNAVMTIHKLPDGEIVVSFYTHLQSYTDLSLLSEVSHSTIIGYVGKTDTVAAHLHWEIRRESMFNVEANGAGSDDDVISLSASYPVNYWPGVDSSFVASNYHDPSDFVKNHSAVGQYSSIYQSTAKTVAFAEAFGQYSSKIGQPNDNGGGIYVHESFGNANLGFSVFLQDFKGDMNADHYGTDGKSALILNDIDYPIEAYLVSGGFFGCYMSNNGPQTIGVPYTKEITHGYANSPDSQSGDLIRAGDRITAQKFKRRLSGGLNYNGERRTLVWKPGIAAQRIPVGEFEIMSQSGAGVCPKDGDQIYVASNSSPNIDVPWPLANRPIKNGTTGKWFTKPGAYNFVLHNPDGSRKSGWGLSVQITEGNHQVSGDGEVVDGVEPTFDVQDELPTPAIVLLNVDFSVGPVDGMAPFQPNVVNNSVGDNITCTWYTGDGNTINGYNFNHTYTSPGIYSILLWVEDEHGASDVMIKHIQVWSEADKPEVDFYVTPQRGVAPLEIRFYDDNSSANFSHYWDFGDGENSTAKEGGHIFQNPGTYNVVHRVSNFAGTVESVVPVVVLSSGIDCNYHLCDNMNDGEFLVNSVTDDAQINPDSVPLANSKIVFIWQSKDQDGDGYGIYGRIFDPTTKTFGSEFAVNTGIVGNQINPKVVSVSDGFIISWTSKYQLGGDLNDIFFQKFDLNGSKIGPETMANTYIIGNQQNQDMAVYPDGKFVIAWRSYNQDGDGGGIFAQMFSASRLKIGSEFQVNSFTSGNQDYPSPAILRDGKFVISWTSDSQDTSGNGIYAQIFQSDRSKQGGEFRVNETVVGSQEMSKSLATDDGGFVVSWDSNQNGNYDIFCRKFNPSGANIFGERIVNTYTVGDQRNNSPSFMSDGRVVISWSSDGQINLQDIFAQIILTDGGKSGREFLINSATVGNQAMPGVIPLFGDRLVFFWQSLVSSDMDIFAQIFDFGCYITGHSLKKVTGLKIKN